MSGLLWRVTRRRNSQQMMRFVRLAIRILAEERYAVGSDIAERDDGVTHGIISRVRLSLREQFAKQSPELEVAGWMLEIRDSLRLCSGHDFVTMTVLLQYDW